MGCLQSTNWPQVRTRKRPRPIEGPVEHERAQSMKTALFRGPNYFHEFCRGDDVEIIAGPTPLSGGEAGRPREITHFARIIDPTYCTNSQSVNLLVVQWYQRIYDLVDDIGPEAPGDEVELIESMERTLVQETAIVQRIHIASKSGTDAKFFSTRSTRSFKVGLRHKPPVDQPASLCTNKEDTITRAIPECISSERPKSSTVIEQ
jgi:hypothetical protein